MRTTRKLEFNRINEDKNILSNLKDGEGTNSLVQNSSSTNAASAAQAFAIGLGTKAGSANQFVMGQFNSNNTDNLFEVGYGSGDTSRKNILELNKDGALTSQYIGISSTGLRFYNNSNSETLGINLTTPTTSAGRKAIKKFVFYDGTGDVNKKAEIEVKTLTATSCSVTEAPVGTTDVIRKQEYDNLFNGTTAVSLSVQLCSNSGEVKINAGSDDEYILPNTTTGIPKFKLGSGNFKFEEVWSKSFYGDLDGTATKLKNKYLHFITVYLTNLVETTTESVCISFSFLDDQGQAYGNNFATKLLTTGSKRISGNGIMYYNDSYISFTQLLYTPGSGFNYTAKVFGNSAEKDKEMYIQTGSNGLRVVDIVSKIN